MNIEDAKTTLATMKKCAVAAGIYHAWFLCFGTLLGAVRPSIRRLGEKSFYDRGVIDNDDDMDVGILSDCVTAEQEQRYVDLLRSHGLTKSRDVTQIRDDTGRLLWKSIRGEKAPNGTKTCNWFWQLHHGYYWHSKGLDWVDPYKNKFNANEVPYSPEDKAIMLGIPKSILFELYEITLYGSGYHIPVHYGTCLDWWYPQWLTPRSTTSARKRHCIVKDWNNEATWRIC